jgi:hypothetical protein
MNKLIIIAVLISCVATSNTFAQSDPAYDSIAGLNLNIYASKPVDSFLHKIPQSYTYIKILGHTKGDRVHGLAITYSSGMTIWIKPDNYTYMNPVDSNHIWNLTLFKKETASYITVTHPDFPTLTGNYP